MSVPTRTGPVVETSNTRLCCDFCPNEYAPALHLHVVGMFGLDLRFAACAPCRKALGVMLANPFPGAP